MAARAEAYGNVASAPARKADGDKELTGIRVKSTENGGFVAEHEYRMKPKKSARGEAFSSWCEPETYAFEDKDALLEHLGSAL